MLDDLAISPAQMKACKIFLALGAVVLVFGIYMGFLNDSRSSIVFVLLGVSVVLFTMAMLPLLKQYLHRNMDAKKDVPQAGAKAEPDAEAKMEPKAESDDKAKARFEGKVDPPLEAKAEPKALANIEPQPKAKTEPQPGAKIDVATLMNTTLGEILLTSLLTDPENIGRLVVQAITKAEPLSRPRTQ
jgi:hypothetical protein